MRAKHYDRGADMPMRVIRRHARQAAERFHSGKMILFPRAHGTPHEDSDVDPLVVMPARNELGPAVRISSAPEEPFPVGDGAPCGACQRRLAAGVADPAVYRAGLPAGAA